MKKLPLWLVPLVAFAWSFPAHAQLNRGDFRFSLDTDVISVARVSIDPDGPAPEAEYTVFGIGPSQLGASHVTQPASPVGLGFHYVLRPKFMLGLRLGLGFDVVDRENAPDRRLLGVSLMPTFTIVPVGRTAKLFISLAPLFQVNRVKQSDYVDRWLQGGFSVGIGCLIFPVSAASADIGFHFEGRFGNHRVENDDNADTNADIADLRGVVRLGLSLWR